jgi:LEA14-like dessication related protein
MEAIEAISRGIEERAQIVCGTQIELLEAQQNQDVLDEQEFYAEVRNINPNPNPSVNIGNCKILKFRPEPVYGQN